MPRTPFGALTDSLPRCSASVFFPAMSQSFSYLEPALQCSAAARRQPCSAARRHGDGPTLSPIVPRRGPAAWLSGDGSAARRNPSPPARAWPSTPAVAWEQPPSVALGPFSSDSSLRPSNLFSLFPTCGRRGCRDHFPLVDSRLLVGRGASSLPAAVIRSPCEVHRYMLLPRLAIA